MQLKWRLSHARGYLELGMLDAAAQELDSIASEFAQDSAVLEVRVAVHQERQEWALMADAAAELVRREPTVPGWWILWAYGARRSSSLANADAILRQAEKMHPANATIQFNLGCYACQLGNLIVAEARVQKAIQMDETIRKLAESDPDLQPLRDDKHHEI